MALTPEQKQIVRTTFAQVMLNDVVVADQFYERLFTIAPETRALFKGDMAMQGMKLIQTLSVAVGSLDQLDRLVPVVRDLGSRHVGYGVAPEHYAKVGEALLWTLQQQFGAAFTPEVEAAWTEVYTALAGLALEGAAQS